MNILFKNLAGIFITLLLVGCDAAQHAAISSDNSTLKAIVSATPDMRWQAPQPAHYGLAIPVDADHMVAANVATGTEMKGSKWNPDVFDTLDHALTAQGWTADLQVNVDEPTMSIWGYQRTDSSGTGYLLFTVSGNSCASSEGSIDCKSYSTDVFLTNPVTQNQVSPADAVKPGAQS